MCILYLICSASWIEGVKQKDIKTEKEKKNISVMWAAPVFGHILFRFCHHCLLSLLFFFLVGQIQTGVPYNRFYAKKHIKKKHERKTNVNVFFLHQIWSRDSVHINVVCISECPSFLFCMQRATYMQGKRSRWAALWSSKSPSAAAPAMAGQGDVE